MRDRVAPFDFGRIPSERGHPGVFAILDGIATSGLDITT